MLRHRRLLQWARLLDVFWRRELAILLFARRRALWRRVLLGRLHRRRVRVHEPHGGMRKLRSLLRGRGLPQVRPRKSRLLSNE
jgi:hypothetical protein